MTMLHSTRWTVALLGAALLLAACGERAANTGRPAPGSDEALMKQGLDQMYQAADPVGAEATFRELLGRNPAHYGAQFQLAASLDRGGRPTEARAEWRKMQALAIASNDSATLAIVTRRLAAPDTASQEAMMARGLDLLYRQNDAAGAVDVFQRLLARNPTHYGATYQMASALDRAGRLAEARRYWQRMLGMATQAKDEKVMAAARDRLR